MRENEIRRENIKQKKTSNAFDDSGHALISFH